MRVRLKGFFLLTNLGAVPRLESCRFSLFSWSVTELDNKMKNRMNETSASLQCHCASDKKIESTKPDIISHRKRP